MIGGQVPVIVLDHLLGEACQLVGIGQRHQIDHAAVLVGVESGNALGRSDGAARPQALVVGNHQLPRAPVIGDGGGKIGGGDIADDRIGVAPRKIDHGHGIGLAQGDKSLARLGDGNRVGAGPEHTAGDRHRRG